MTEEYVIGVDLGGTKIEACLLDSKHKLYSRLRVPTDAQEGRAHILDTIVRLIRKTADNRPYSAVGIGTPGTYLKSRDRIFGSPHTPVYETPGFLSDLASRLEVPLLIENDANCLAVAEYFASCTGRYDYVMAVILGTGVGSGLIFNGKLYRGAKGSAGEFGHTAIDYNGRLCECGRRGCVEAYLSGPSHSRRYREAGGESLALPEIYSLYQKGEAQAVHLMEESCRIMGEALADVVSLLDLDAVILGGGVSNLPIWYEQVPALIARNAFGPERSGFPLIKARLGDSAGVFGAAYLALRELGLMNF